jgi:hypothetical protein
MFTIHTGLLCLLDRCIKFKTKKSKLKIKDNKKESRVFKSLYLYTKGHIYGKIFEVKKLLGRRNEVGGVKAATGVLGGLYLVGLL